MGRYEGWAGRNRRTLRKGKELPGCDTKGGGAGIKRTLRKGRKLAGRDTKGGGGGNRVPFVRGGASWRDTKGGAARNKLPFVAGSSWAVRRVGRGRYKRTLRKERKLPGRDTKGGERETSLPFVGWDHPWAGTKGGRGETGVPFVRGGSFLVAIRRVGSGKKDYHSQGGATLGGYEGWAGRNRVPFVGEEKLPGRDTKGGERETSLPFAAGGPSRGQVRRVGGEKQAYPS